MNVLPGLFDSISQQANYEDAKKRRLTLGHDSVGGFRMRKAASAASAASALWGPIVSTLS